ncbi:CPBP family intramembrane metalloprotease [Weeksellaceae bacterium KMM 9713]|uniref:CPBP family intramembrane metalloprotease n=1 Tax=Profundicola chukchiensis TaxID=2961959 RepID=A0A9X4RTN3_9FLAO|nr:CPBP family intramembrane glutamic endopeptidase [Profundicola chukchiensis]MDG4945208.1 CPBP family intramembrane metalloprotease [Profundicola chukchiensis]
MLFDLFNFLKNPQDSQDPNQSLRQKVKSFLLVLGIAILLSLITAILLDILNELGWLNIDSHKIEDFMKTNSISKIFLLGVVLVPLLEEIIFRLFLRFKSNYFLQFIIYLYPRSKDYIHEFWQKYFRFIFYFSAIIFALFHLSNFNEMPSLSFLLPLIVLPQFITGLLIGYMRVRFNFFLGFLMHAIFNAIFITIGLLSMDNEPTKKLDINTTSFSLKIEEEVGRVKISKVEDYKNDSINFKGKDLKNIISILTQRDYNFIDLNNDSLKNTKINLEYKNQSQHKLNRDSLILKHLSEVYSFEMTSEIRNQELYLLKVNDSIKLFNHLAKTEDEILIHITSKSIEYTKTNLKQVSQSLSTIYKERIEYDDGIDQNFNINIDKGTFSQLKSELLTTYGLDLKEVNRDIEYIVLKF